MFYHLTNQNSASQVLHKPARLKSAWALAGVSAESERELGGAGV